jgi:hypothetical protein
MRRSASVRMSAGGALPARSDLAAEIGDPLPFDQSAECGPFPVTNVPPVSNAKDLNSSQPGEFRDSQTCEIPVDFPFLAVGQFGER